MSDLKIYDDYNTLPEQVQINKDDIKTLNAKIDTINAKIDTITSNIANLGWELKTNTSGDKNYIPKNFDENIPYSLTNITDSTQASGLNTYKDSDGYVWSYLTIYIPADDDFVGIWTGHDNEGYFCSLSMETPNDTTTYLVVTYIANSDCPQSLNKDKYKEDQTIATMGWVNKYYLTKTDASRTYATMNALKPLQNSYFEADLTTAGLAKIQANATIGTSITLLKNTDFIENISNTDSAHRTVIFNLYRDDDEEVYISENIKLDIVNTTDCYSDNVQPHIWFVGMGVIKLGSASALDNNYLCYIAYDITSTRGIRITPVQKLN